MASCPGGAARGPRMWNTHTEWFIDDCSVIESMLRRKAVDRLAEWRSRPGRRPLLVRGVRGCGKTTVIDGFRSTYPHSTRVDLSADRDMARMFGAARAVDDVLLALQVRDPGFEPVPGETLIFLDEIGTCRSAEMFLKEFALDGRFDVIAADSLPNVRLRGIEEGDREVCVGDVISYVPVGYMEHLRMHYLDFEEFLWAEGLEESRIAQVRESFASRAPMDPALQRDMEEAFAEFMKVGGMPAAVSAYLGSGMSGARRAIDGALADIREDVVRYGAETDVPRIGRFLDSLPIQLSGTGGRFTYSHIGGTESCGAFRRFFDALFWLEEAGVANPCRQLKEVAAPLCCHMDPDRLRMYVSDTGLLIGMAGSDVPIDQSVLAENAVAECLMKAGLGRYYYIKRKEPGGMELDFLVDSHQGPIAVEVKAGKDRTAPSLSKTLGDPRFARRIILGRCDVGMENGFETYPLFAAAFMEDIIGDDDGWMEAFGSGSPPPDL